jgi:hypothetical protein
MSVQEYQREGGRVAPPLTRYVDVPQPAAGANATFTDGLSWVFRVVAATAQLDTDANAANRLLSLDYLKTGGPTYLRNAAPVLVTASQVAQVFEWAKSRSVSEWNTGTPIFVPVEPLWLTAGMTVRFTVDAIQATDQLSNVRLIVEVHPADPLAVY